MKPHVVEELKRRTEIIIKNSEPGCLQTGMSGSYMAFEIFLAPLGYPFSEGPDWADWLTAPPLMGQDDFRIGFYDELMQDCFAKALDEVNVPE